MRNRSVWKGLAAGALGGLAATYVMTKFQNGWKKLERTNSAEDSRHSHEEPTTVKIADKASVALTDEHIPDRQKPLAGTLVHYSFGALVGATYGLLSEFVPQSRAGFGSVFGSAVFVGADEIGVPLAGLTPPPQEMPARVHLYGLVSHLVYGSALEGSRLATRKAIARATNENKLLYFKRQARQVQKRARKAINSLAA